MTTLAYTLSTCLICLILALKYFLPTVALMWCMEQDSTDNSPEDMSEEAAGDKDTEMSSDLEDTLGGEFGWHVSRSGGRETMQQGAREGEK